MKSVTKNMLAVAMFVISMSAPVMADQTVDDMVNSLTPRIRRGNPGEQGSAKPSNEAAKDALSRYLAVRSKRGPGMKERKVLYDALKPLPQLDLLTLYFDLDSAEVTPGSMPVVEKIGAALTSERLTGSNFVINGHTDERGTAEHNLDLSQRRAETVVNLLISRFGISPDRLKAVGHGFEELADPEHPLAAQNRRVQIVNVGK